MQCVSCHEPLIPGKPFCANCGTPVAPACPNCGEPTDPRFRFCPSCGTPLATDERMQRLTQHIPDDLAKKLRAAPPPALEERKLVTVLFCDLVGSTTIAEGLDPEDYRDLIEEYMALAFREIYAMEGVVNTLAGDGLMALFGAPIAHEDAPQRAVRAALAIRDALTAFNASRGPGSLELQVRIGIHTGPVVVGTVGNDLKMDYTAIGDTTNLAARLQTAARPGAILISHATHRLVRDAFISEVAGTFEVRGRREPVVAYEIRGVSDDATPMALAEARGMTPYVGRGHEVETLVSCWKQALEGRPQMVAILGPAGSGKSRLIYELKQQIGDQPIAYFEARCAALTQGIPYAPMTNMLRQYFGLVAGEPKENACGRIVAHLSELEGAPADLHPHLCRLLSVHDHQDGDTSPEEQRQQTYEAVAKFVHLTSLRQPVMMIIEDLHWMDDASREMIALAAANIHDERLALIVSHRPDFEPSWRATVALTRVLLRPLGNDDVQAIMRAVAGGRLPSALEERILARAEGNPFFTEEITRALVDDGYLLRGDGHIRLTRPVAEIGIPDTVQELIGARLDRLGPHAKRVAQVAAVLGRQFHRGQLAQLLATEGIDVGRELERLERRGIVHRKQMRTADEYRFGESLVQEVAYEALLLKERRQLHERIGLLLEREGADRDPERMAMLAHHFARSDNRRKAIEALLRAAHRAEALPSYTAAAAFYRQAWELGDAVLAEAGGDDRDLKHAIVDATFGLVRITVLYGPSLTEEVERAAQRGRAFAKEVSSVETLAGLYTFHGLALTSDDREHFGQGLALIEEGLTLAQRAGLELAATSISRGLAWSYAIDGQLALARRTIDWVVQDLEVRGQRAQATDVYFGARWVREGILYISDDLAAAAESARETYELALQAPNRTAQAGAAVTLAQVYFEQTDYAEAKRWADRSLEIAQSIGSLAGIRIASSVALAARLELGEPANVGVYIDGIEEGLAQGSTLPINSRLVIEALLMAGEVTRARRVAEVTYSRGGGSLREVIRSVGRGDVLLRLGSAHWAEAERWYGQALAQAQVIGSASNEAAALIGLAEIAFRGGNRETAARQLDVALARCREHDLRRTQRRAERLLAEVDAETKQLA